MTVQRFQDDDRGYATWVAENAAGYVVNIQRSQNPSDARLHAASCGSLSRSISAWESGRARLTASWIKLCSRSEDELDKWSAEHVRAQIRRCPTCLEPTQTLAPTSDTDRIDDVVQSAYRVTVSSDEVSLEAPRYLPFERLDAQQSQARQRLRSALAGLTAGPQEVLHACFSGDKPMNSDVENLVLYNVDPGGACFVGASTGGVRFELDSRTPDRGPGCRYRYRVIPADEALTSWESGPCLARFAGANLAAFGPPHRLAQTWMAVHNAPAETYGPPTAEATFGVFLDLEVPPSARPGVRPELLKAVVDGVVCAFQTHLDQTTVRDMASRIADEISVDPDEVAANLLAPERAVLGARRQLVHSRGPGVQWNPSDHLCVAGQLLRRQGDRWRLHGEIYRLIPAREPSRGISARISSVVRSLQR
jgi:hypothetical protein